MKSPLLYLLEVLFCSGLLLGLYRLLLVRRIPYRACRRYLVAAMVAAAVIPALNIPLYPADTVFYPLPLIEAPAEAVLPARDAATAGSAADADVGTLAAEASVVPGLASADRAAAWRGGVAALYGAVALLSLGLLGVRMLRIRRLRRRAHLTPGDGYTLAEHPAIASPFSFLRTVFMSPACTGLRREMILCHERSHVRHAHTAERIVLEVVRCLYWINPFVWIAGRWLEEVQEWEADADVLKVGYDLTAYRIVIFRQLFGYNPDMTCGLNHSFTKNRFLMMTRFEMHRHALWRLGAAIPVVAGMMMLCSFTVRTAEPPVAGPAEAPTAGAPVAEEAPGGDAYTVVVRMSGEELWVDGVPCTKEEMMRRIADKRDRLPAEERSRLTVEIRADGAVRMGSVSDAKAELREAGMLRVRYSLHGESVERLLPPSPGMAGQGRVEVLPVIEASFGTGEKPVKGAGPVIAQRNCFQVLVNDRGEVLAGRVGGKTPVSTDELTARVAEFLRNPSDDATLSERCERVFELPDGRRERYAVSRGIVLLDTAPGAPYDAYVGVQQALTKAYVGLRDDLARRWFDRSFDELDEGQRAVVQRAVPVAVSEVAPQRSR
ncbi:M56 family metallopeptidase [uncultured Alistipes sp.]|uniref:M56 family metallopeptidase n=1 Tax=uncultured Alistipes sp. TaxID=538949 RepID=UPI002665091F|nr:M56 family metallopeptidase [uncultured Alistipes sp.]